MNEAEKSYPDLLDELHHLRQKVAQLEALEAQRKQTQEELFTALQTLTFHVENSPLAVIEWDSEYRPIRWSKRAEEMFGWKAEEVLGKRLTDWQFVVEEDLPAVLRVVQALLNGDLPRAVSRNRNYTKDGQILHCEWYESALMDSSGRLVSVLSLVQDVTEQVYARQMMEYHRQFEALIATISTNFINMPVDQIDAGINQALQLIGQFVGVDYSFLFLFSEQDSTIQQTYHWRKADLAWPPDQFRELSLGYFPEMWRRLHELEIIYIPSVSALPRHYRAEKYFLTAQGVQSLVMAPLVHQTKLYGILGFASTREEKTWSGDAISLLKMVAEIFVNALQRKQLEAELRARARQQEILLKEIHHRVKNNLQIVSSLLRLQSRYLHDQPPLEILRDSQNRIKSMALIHAKLYQTEDLTSIDFADYVKTLVSHLFQSYAVEPGTVDMQIDADVTLDINTAIPCGLIINELVSNSLKYAFPHPNTPEPAGRRTISIALHPADSGEFVLKVSDNGVGLPPDVDPHHSRSLGLQLVMNLVKQLHGSASITRSPGAAYTITFPQAG